MGTKGTETEVTWNPEDLANALNGEKNLQGCDLAGSNLQGADLWEVNLQKADLREANLQGANLRGAKLQKANLHEANLHEADLRGADLRGADLRGVNLQGAKIQRANFEGVQLCDVVNLSPGQLINAKKVHLASDLPFSLQEVILAKQFAAMEGDT